MHTGNGKPGQVVISESSHMINVINQFDAACSVPASILTSTRFKKKKKTVSPVLSTLLRLASGRIVRDQTVVCVWSEISRLGSHRKPTLAPEEKEQPLY